VVPEEQNDGLDSADHDDQENFLIEEQEYEGDSHRSMSLNSENQMPNDLADSKKKNSILPLLSHDDSMFVGIVTPSRRTIAGSEAQNTSIIMPSPKVNS